MKHYRYESNDEEISIEPNFSAYKDEDEKEIIVKNLKRKFPDVYNDVIQELKNLNEEIQSTENYLEKMQKKKMRLELELESLRTNKQQVID